MQHGEFCSALQRPVRCYGATNEAIINTNTFYSHSQVSNSTLDCCCGSHDRRGHEKAINAIVSARVSALSRFLCGGNSSKNWFPGLPGYHFGRHSGRMNEFWELTTVQNNVVTKNERHHTGRVRQSINRIPRVDDNDFI